MGSLVQAHPGAQKEILSSISFLFFKPIHPPFASPPFQVRYKSVPGPFPIIGEKWDLQGIHIGLTWDLQQRQNRIKLKKQNFYITLQLVTHSAIKFSVSDSCSGDSFHFTRHPLITHACVLS